jgi:anti-sigma factor RsiW
MCVMIENTEELLALLKKMDLKVHSVDELHQLLASINASYNPDAARQKTGRQIGTIVPGVMAGAAAFASFMLLGSGLGSFTVGGLAVIWGPVALASTAAVIAGAVLASVRRGRTMSDNPPDRPASRQEPVVTHITRELPM